VNNKTKKINSFGIKLKINLSKLDVNIVIIVKIVK